MDRRNFIKNLGITATGVMVSPSLMAEDKKKKRPNLLIIHGDEFNFRYIGCYGADFIKTPHIDSLANGGTRCDNYYANHPVCTPSRGSMMTGRYPHVNGAINNNEHLKHDEITFAEMCKRAGYVTGYSGKWHLDGGGKPGWAPKNKFGWEDNRYMFNRGHWKKLEDTSEGPKVGTKNGKNTYGVIGDEKTFTTDWLADKTVDFIKKNKNNPFCYMVSIPDPHGPNTVRSPYNTMYNDVEFQTPKASTSRPNDRPAWARARGHHGPENRSKYCGMIKCIDDNVGKIVKTLKDEGVFDNTIIVFCADHGDLMGEHGLNNKSVPYDASAKVPFIIHWPEHIPAGKVSTEVMSMVDFGPTMLGLMGVDKSGKEQGHDATNVLLGKSQQWKNYAVLMNHGKSSSWLGIATQDYKLIYDTYDEPWLFDLKKDPDELFNYFSDPEYKEIVKKLSAKIQEYCLETSEPLLNDPVISKGMKAGGTGATAHYKGKTAAIPTKDNSAKKANKKGKKKKKRNK